MQRKPFTFTTKAGQLIEAGQFVKLGRVSVAPISQSVNAIRLNHTGEVHKAKAACQAANDSLRMALYLGHEPEGYAFYCFGAKAMESAPLD